MPTRSERLYQARFDEHFQFSTPQDVTPEGFTGFEFPRAERLNPADHWLGRFVREVREEAQIQSPDDAAQHLLTKVYVPFKDFDQEELRVLLLDNKLRITHEVMIYRGTVNAVSIRQAELLKEAVRVNSPFFARRGSATHTHQVNKPGKLS